MKIKDKEIEIHLDKEFVPLKDIFNKLIKEEKLDNANLVCWVPHEVSSIVQIGWEDGLLDDLKGFLKDTVLPEKWTKHDEPNTPFRKNAFEHIRTKIVGETSKTFIVKDGKLYIGQHQDIYFYSPVYKDKPNQKIFCRIVKF